MAPRSPSPVLRTLADGGWGSGGAAALQALREQGLWSSALVYEAWDTDEELEEWIVS